jgi:hypothetical protein
MTRPLDITIEHDSEGDQAQVKSELQHSGRGIEQSQAFQDQQRLKRHPLARLARLFQL